MPTQKLIFLYFSGSRTNWKSFRDVTDENLGQGEKPDYYTNKATVMVMKKDNCMYTVGTGLWYLKGGVESV